MPVISRFFGIVVFMNRRDLSMVQEWRELHQAELAANWALAEQRRPLNRIQPLE